MPCGKNSNYKPSCYNNNYNGNNACEQKLKNGKNGCKPKPPCPCPCPSPGGGTDVITTLNGVIDPETTNTVFKSVTGGVPAPDTNANPYWALVIASDKSQTYTNSVWANSIGSVNVSGVFFQIQLDNTSIQTETDFSNADDSVAQIVRATFDLTITEQPNSWAGYTVQYTENGSFAWYAYIVNVANSTIFLNITDQSDNVIVTGTYLNQTRILSQITGGTRFLPSQQIPGVINANIQAVLVKLDRYGNIQWANTTYTPSHPTTGTTFSYFSYPDSDLNILSIGTFGLGGQETTTQWFGQANSVATLDLPDINFYIAKYFPDGEIMYITVIEPLDTNPDSVVSFKRAYITASSDNSYTTAGLFYLPSVNIHNFDFDQFYTLSKTVAASAPNVFIANYGPDSDSAVGVLRWAVKIESSIPNGIELGGLVTDTLGNITVTINFFQANTITIYQWINGIQVVAPPQNQVGSVAVGFAVIQYSPVGIVNWVTVVSQNDNIEQPYAYDTAIDTRRPGTLNNIAVNFNFYESALVFNPGGSVSNEISINNNNIPANLPNNLFKSGTVLLKNDGTFNFYAIQFPNIDNQGNLGVMSGGGGVGFDRDHCMTTVVNGLGPVGFLSQNVPYADSQFVDTVTVSPPGTSIRPQGALVGKYVLSLQQNQLTAASLGRSANNKTLARADYDFSGTWVDVPAGLIFSRKNIPVRGFLFNNADSAVTISWFEGRWRIINVRNVLVRLDYPPRRRGDATDGPDHPAPTSRVNASALRIKKALLPKTNKVKIIRDSKKD